MCHEQARKNNPEQWPLERYFSDRRRDIPWKIKCSRLVEHVFAFGNEYWSWTLLTVDKDRWSGRLHRLSASRDKKKTWVDDHARTCKTAKKMWLWMGLPFLFAVIAESVWRATGWVFDERPKCGDQLEQRLQMGKCWVVAAIHTRNRDERRPVRKIRYGNTSGVLGGQGRLDD